jgi:hypothetical protein
METYVVDGVNVTIGMVPGINSMLGNESRRQKLISQCSQVFRHRIFSINEIQYEIIPRHFAGENLREVYMAIERAEWVFSGTYNSRYMTARQFVLATRRVTRLRCAFCRKRYQYWKKPRGGYVLTVCSIECSQKETEKCQKIYQEKMQLLLIQRQERKELHLARQSLRQVRAILRSREV